MGAGCKRYKLASSLRNYTETSLHIAGSWYRAPTVAIARPRRPQQAPRPMGRQGTFTKCS